MPFRKRWSFLELALGQEALAQLSPQVRDIYHHKSEENTVVRCRAVLNNLKSFKPTYTPWLQTNTLADALEQNRVRTSYYIRDLRFEQDDLGYQMLNTLQCHIAGKVSGQATGKLYYDPVSKNIIELKGNGARVTVKLSVTEDGGLKIQHNARVHLEEAYGRSFPLADDCVLSRVESYDPQKGRVVINGEMAHPVAGKLFSYAGEMEAEILPIEAVTDIMAATADFARSPDPIGDAQPA